jgi:cysteine synthase
MRVAKDITDLIGKTPLLALDRLYPGSNAKVFAKLELSIPCPSKTDPFSI